jgi:hypothetical protein
MPIHDWTRVSAGTFHDFHCGWIVELRSALNKELLPADYYAQAEQVTGDVIPDVLTLQMLTAANDSPTGADVDSGVANGGTAVTLAPPRTSYTATVELDQYAHMQRTLVIRHASEDRVVALIEILSPGNKAGQHAWRAVLDKLVAALAGGVHLLLIDLLPPGARDPQGLHGAIWAELCDQPYCQPADQRLTLAAYAAGSSVRAYVEPRAVGDSLVEMPLFLSGQQHVPVPLEATYRAAWEGLPRRWRSVLER